MAEIFFHAFPNHFKGDGQPAFVGKTQDETQKIAVWWKKDRKGRPFMAIRVDDGQGETATEKETPTKVVEDQETGERFEVQDDGPEFLF